MLIDTYTLTKITNTYLRLEWTATDLSKTCWVYRNGVFIGKYYDTTTLVRLTEFSIELDSLSVIEIHEAQDDDPATPAYEAEPVESFTVPYRLHDLHWDRVDDAVYYEVYHKIANGTEREIETIYQQDGVEKYVWTTPELERTGGVWHHFRVEAVDEWEHRSTRELWHFFVYGMPALPSAVQVTGGGGVFNVVLTP